MVCVINDLTISVFVKQVDALFCNIALVCYTYISAVVFGRSRLVVDVINIHMQQLAVALQIYHPHNQDPKLDL